ncbi:MAG: hypothetical protein ABIV26_03535, partial [Candidatus Limnocylindrales bacterium]
AVGAGIGAVVGSIAGPIGAAVGGGLGAAGGAAVGEGIENGLRGSESPTGDAVPDRRPDPADKVVDAYHLPPPIAAVPYDRTVYDSDPTIKRPAGIPRPAGQRPVEPLDPDGDGGTDLR